MISIVKNKNVSKRIRAEVSIVSRKLAGDWYVSHECGSTSWLLGPSTFYWGSNAAEKEGKGKQLLQLVRIELSFFRDFFARTQRATRCYWVSLQITRTE
jgi:hypothetical protein